MVLQQDTTLETLAGQLQKYCNNILMVTDGTTLHHYNKLVQLPSNVHYEHKQIRNNVTEYYFRDNTDENLYCVFTEKAAQYMSCHQHEEDETIYPVLSPLSTNIIIQEIPSITLFDGGKRKQLPQIPQQILRVDEYI